MAGQAFYATILALCGKGDEVILPAPWYFNHEMTLTQLGVSIVPLHCRAPDFLPSVDECAALITPKTRALVLVSPNNPTGALYPPSLLAQFAALAQRSALPLILDETYADFVPGGARPHELLAAPGWGAFLVRLFSLSKSYAVPGHRLGAIVAAPAFLAQVQKTLDCLQICPARPAQAAVAWAVEGVRAWREGVRDELEQRQARFKGLVAGVDGWEVMVGSAYFAWVRHPFEGVGSEVVAARLGEHVGLVVLPGESNATQGAPFVRVKPSSPTDLSSHRGLTGSFFCPPFDDVKDDRFIRFCKAALRLPAAAPQTLTRASLTAPLRCSRGERRRYDAREGACPVGSAQRHVEQSGIDGGRHLTLGQFEFAVEAAVGSSGGGVRPSQVST